MAIKLGGTIINKKLLGINSLNKIMLGVIEIFPNLGPEPPSGFDPSDLFVNGEDGLFYNFNNVNSIFQTNVGQPVNSAGQTIGLVLDGSKKFALGANTPTTGYLNNNFDTFEVNGDFVSIAETGTYGVGSTIDFKQNVKAGQTFKIVVDVTAVVGTLTILLGVNSDNTFSTNGSLTNTGLQTVYITPTIDMANCVVVFGLLNFPNQSATFSIVSYEQVLGNSARQDTAAARPQFNAVGSTMGAIFDGVDDFLTTAPFQNISLEGYTLVLGVIYDAVNTNQFVVNNDGAVRIAQNTRMNSAANNSIVFNSAGTPFTTSGAGNSIAGEYEVVTVRCSPTLLELSINGNPAGSVAVTGDLQTAVQALVISQAGSRLNGRITALVIINRYLSNTELEQTQNFIAGLYTP